MGAPLSLALLTVREPIRRGSDTSQATTNPVNPASFGALKTFVGANGKTFWWLLTGFQFYIMANAAYLLWIPTFFKRTYNVPASMIGGMFGATLLIFGGGGVLVGGYLSDRLTRAGKLDGPVRIALYGAIATVPFAVLTPLMPTAGSALAAMCALIFFVGGPPALGYTAFPMMTPNRLRAQVTAVCFLSVNLVVGVAPVIVALVTDYVIGDPKGLRYSLAIVPAVYLGISIFALAKASNRIPRPSHVFWRRPITPNNRTTCLAEDD